MSEWRRIARGWQKCLADMSISLGDGQVHSVAREKNIIDKHRIGGARVSGVIIIILTFYISLNLMEEGTVDQQHGSGHLWQVGGKMNRLDLYPYLLVCMEGRLQASPLREWKMGSHDLKFTERWKRDVIFLM